MNELLSILGPAMVAGVLVLSTHVPMGQEVLKRGIIFLDLAIAQVAALGLIIAGTIGLGETHHGHHATVGFLSMDLLVPQAIAIGAAMLGASFLYLFRKFPARIQEALIGILFMLAATGSILLLAKDPQGGERLKEILVGQILWVEQPQLVFTACLYSLVLLVWFKARQWLGEFGFYPLFAIAITLSTQLVGVYLVFASLIIPALATHTLKRPLLAAFVLGVCGYAAGLVFSAYVDLPSGATITWALACFGLVFAGFQRLVHGVGVQ